MSDNAPSMPRAPKGPRREAAGIISTREVYPLPLFLRSIGWSKFAFKSAKDSGLRVCRGGGRAYVRGGDFYEWLGRAD